MSSGRALISSSISRKITIEKGDHGGAASWMVSFQGFLMYKIGCVSFPDVKCQEVYISLID